MASSDESESDIVGENEELDVDPITRLPFVVGENETPDPDVQESEREFAAYKEHLRQQQAEIARLMDKTVFEYYVAKFVPEGSRSKLMKAATKTLSDKMYEEQKRKRNAREKAYVNMSKTDMANLPALVQPGDLEEKSREWRKANLIKYRAYMMQEAEHVDDWFEYTDVEDARQQARELIQHYTEVTRTAPIAGSLQAEVAGEEIIIDPPLEDLKENEVLTVKLLQDVNEVAIDNPLTFRRGAKKVIEVPDAATPKKPRRKRTKAGADDTSLPVPALSVPPPAAALTTATAAPAAKRRIEPTMVMQPTAAPLATATAAPAVKRRIEPTMVMQPTAAPLATATAAPAVKRRIVPTMVLQPTAAPLATAEQELCRKCQTLPVTTGEALCELCTYKESMALIGQAASSEASALAEKSRADIASAPRRVRKRKTEKQTGIAPVPEELRGTLAESLSFSRETTVPPTSDAVSEVVRMGCVTLEYQSVVVQRFNSEQVRNVLTRVVIRGSVMPEEDVLRAYQRELNANTQSSVDRSEPTVNIRITLPVLVESGALSRRMISGKVFDQLEAVFQARLLPLIGGLAQRMCANEPARRVTSRATGSIRLEDVPRTIETSLLLPAEPVEERYLAASSETPLLSVRLQRTGLRGTASLTLLYFPFALTPATGLRLVLQKVIIRFRDTARVNEAAAKAIMDNLSHGLKSAWNPPSVFQQYAAAPLLLMNVELLPSAPLANRRHVFMHDFGRFNAFTSTSYLPMIFVALRDLFALIDGPDVVAEVNYTVFSPETTNTLKSKIITDKVIKVASE